MIVSHKHQFIFVAIPKTATHAIRHALRPMLGNNDWEQCNLFEPKQFPIEELANLRHGHIGLKQLRPFLPHTMWTNYRKFCIAREPLNRFISAVSFLNRHTDVMKKDPLGNMKKMLSEQRSKPRLLLLPQYQFVSDDNNSPLLDRHFRFERIESDFVDLCKWLSLPVAQLTIINKGPHKADEFELDTETIEMVYDYYSQDYALLKYSKDIQTIESGN
jgi:hypothetical protein